MARTAAKTAATSVVVLGLAACVHAGTSARPAPQVSTADAAAAQAQAGMGRALAGLAGAADATIRTTPEGALEIVGPAPVASPDTLGSALFSTNSTPKPAELDAAFGQYCKLRGAPKKTAHEGFTRLTYRGSERRSGAECTLVADLPKTGRWRFVLRIQRNPNPS